MIKYILCILGLFITISYNKAQTVTDIDGNIYHTVTIGKQLWMVENLKTTKYNDGTAIPIVTDNKLWIKLSKGAYCNFNNDSKKANTYGRLYNWYAVVDSHKLCPTGWHVPTAFEYIALGDYLGGKKIAGGKLKETGTIHWDIPNKGATNESDFSALPGGYRDGSKNGLFYNLGDIADFWSSTVPISRSIFNPWGPPLQNNPIAWFLNLQSSYSKVRYKDYVKEFGFSVRCLKD